MYTKLSLTTTLLLTTLAVLNGQLDANNFNNGMKVSHDENGKVVFETVAPPYCKKWFDGCNSCVRDTVDAEFVCTRKMCPDEESMGEKVCSEYFVTDFTDENGPIKKDGIWDEESVKSVRLARDNCEVWFDGCNLCTREVAGGDFTCLNKQVCEAYEVPSCVKYFGSEAGSSAEMDERNEKNGIDLHSLHGIPMMYNTAGNKIPEMQVRQSANAGEVKYCADSHMQLCKRICLVFPTCEPNECVFREDSCCTFTCHEDPDYVAAVGSGESGFESSQGHGISRSSNDEDKPLGGGSWFGTMAMVLVVALGVAIIGLIGRRRTLTSGSSSPSAYQRVGMSQATAGLLR